MISNQIQSDVFEAIKGFEHENAEDEESEILLFHGCNAQGVMGAGIAKTVKSVWPEVYRDYKSYCECHHPEEILGDVVFSGYGSVTVANGITQEDYGPSREQHADLNHIEVSE